MNGWEKGNCQDSPKPQLMSAWLGLACFETFFFFFYECCIYGPVILHNYDSANVIEKGCPEYCYFTTWFWFQLILVIAKDPRYDFDEKLSYFQRGQRVFLAVAMRGKALSHVGVSRLLFLTIHFTTQGWSEWLLLLGTGPWLWLAERVVGQRTHPFLFIDEQLSGQVWWVFLHVDHHLLYTAINIVFATVPLLFPVNCSLSQLLIFCFCPFHHWRGGWKLGEQGAVCNFLFSGSTWTGNTIARAWQKYSSVPFQNCYQKMFSLLMNYTNF